MSAATAPLLANDSISCWQIVSCTISAEDVLGVLSYLRSLLTKDGHVHVFRIGDAGGEIIARQLARWERGDFARPAENGVRHSAGFSSQC
jgi:hypothetical protein